MSKKLTNEIIDQKLGSRLIIRLSDVVSAKLLINWQCKKGKCNYIWKASPDNVLNKKSGCPVCANNIKLTDDAVDKKIIGRNIKRIGAVVGSLMPILFKCEKCDYEWSATPSNIFHIHNKTGCPRCSNRIKLTNEIIDHRLIARNIKRVGEVVGCVIPIVFECLICKYIWKTCPNNITNNETGCPKCAGKAPLTNDEIDKKLVGRNIKRIETVINSLTDIFFECLVCDYLWKTTPNNIINNETGCPRCSSGKNEKLIFHMLKNNNVIFDYQLQLNKIIETEKRNIKIDFYIKKYNTIIEYNGRQHYMPVCFGGIEQSRAEDNFIKRQERDWYLQNFCDINNIKLIWIDGRKYTNSKLENYMINEILFILEKK